MKKIYASLLLLISTGLFLNLQGQAECDGVRYLNEVFAGYDLTSDITYGQNIAQNGQNQTLLMDVYEPQGDLAATRPLMILIHGGNFIGGSKTGSDIVPMAQRFCKMGYVVASMDYRLGIPLFPSPDSSDLKAAVLRAVHDAKAAVRFFYKDAATTNTFKIDTDRIFLGGASAGAATAVHYAYLDKISEVPSDLDTVSPGLTGGLTGVSGNPGYPDDVAGILNFAGAINHMEWMEFGDEPLVSLHGTADGTIPEGSATLVFLGFYPMMEVDGSKSLHAYADQVGIPNCYYPHPGAGHVPHNGSVAYTDTLVDVVKYWLYGYVCNGASSCYPVITNSHQESQAGSITVFPNPSTGDIHLRMDQLDLGLHTIEMLDLRGKLIGSYRFWGNETLTIPREGRDKGLYFLRIRSEHGMTSRKVILN